MKFDALSAKDMTLRDYFAAFCMQTILAEAIRSPAELPKGKSLEEFIAMDAYMVADAMIKARVA